MKKLILSIALLFCYEAFGLFSGERAGVSKNPNGAEVGSMCDKDSDCKTGASCIAKRCIVPFVSPLN